MNIEKYLTKNEDVYITRRSVESYIEKPFIVKNGIEKEMDTIDGYYVKAFRNLYFYSDLAIADLGDWEGDDFFGAYFLTPKQKVLIDKNLNIVLKNGQIDENGIARESWMALKVVTQYGIGGLLVVDPNMLLSSSFKQDLDTAFDIYKTNKLKAHPELKESLNKEYENFKNCLKEMENEVVNNNEIEAE